VALTVLVTGAAGFVGRNLCVALAARPDVTLLRFDVQDPTRSLDDAAAYADVVFHLAGVNRPHDPEDFRRGNTDSTVDLCARLREAGRRAKVVLSSSIHADGDTPYGISKRHAEDAVREYCRETSAAGVVYRFKNLFGKWSRPDYNSVTATFCHRIARDLPIEISDPATVVDLTYIDVVVGTLEGELASLDGGFRHAEALPSHQITLGDLAALIRGFRESRRSCLIPDLSEPFVQQLYGTFLSFLPTDAFAYPLKIHSDARGALAEFVKGGSFGQIFVSRTKPGVTRGHHYHQTKVEKFLVIEGQAVIRFRQIDGAAVLEYPVDGREFRVVDIPPGYTHSIENVGRDELITLFWASEVFDPNRPDTSRMLVHSESHAR
jgi:UDP-2-acetamido-2,6-beta-L-arabino-hexul-4-ose reductase